MKKIILPLLISLMSVGLNAQDSIISTFPFTIHFDSLNHDGVAITCSGGPASYTFPDSAYVKNISIGKESWQPLDGSTYSSNGGLGASQDRSGSGNFINLSNAGPCEKTGELLIDTIQVGANPLVMEYFYNSNMRNLQTSGSIVIKAKLASQSDASYIDLDSLFFNTNQETTFTEWIKNSAVIPFTNAKVMVKIIAHISNNERRSISLDDISFKEISSSSELLQLPFIITNDVALNYQGVLSDDFTNLKYALQAEDSVDNIAGLNSWRVLNAADGDNEYAPNKDGSNNSTGQYLNVTTVTGVISSASFMTDSIDLTGSSIINYSFDYNIQKRSNTGTTATTFIKVSAYDCGTQATTKIDSLTFAPGDVDWTSLMPQSLNAYAGKKIKLIFEAGNLTADKEVGISIDNISVWEPNYDIESDTIIFDNPEICATDAQKGNFNVMITNVGTDGIDTVTLEYFVDDVKLGELGYNYTISAGASQFLPVFDTLPFDAAGTFDVKTVVSYGDGSSNDAADTITYSYVVNPIPSVSVSFSGDTAICSGDTLVARVIAGADNYIWNTGLDTNDLTINNAGVYSAKAVTDKGCESVYSDTLTVSVNAIPTTPVIAKESSTVISATPYAMDSYEWIKDGSVLTTTADSALASDVVDGSDYQVIVVLDGCSSDTSVIYTHVASGVGVASVEDTDIKVYPIPASDIITITNANGKVAEIYSINGVKIKEVVLSNNINISEIENGIYVLKIENNKIVFIKE